MWLNVHQTRAREVRSDLQRVQCERVQRPVDSRLNRIDPMHIHSEGWLKSMSCQGAGAIVVHVRLENCRPAEATQRHHVSR